MYRCEKCGQLAAEFDGWNGDDRCLACDHIQGTMEGIEVGRIIKAKAGRPENSASTVVIIVLGGVVEVVESPSDVRVIVRDYDIEGIKKSRLKKDAEGNDYAESVW